MTTQSAGLVLTSEALEQERAIWLGIVLDIGIVVLLITVGMVGGSLTMTAESIRATLGVLLECFTYGVLRRIHRGVLADVDYGTGKLEQVASLVIGAGMLLATVWILLSAFSTISGGRELGTPLGFALAAIVGAGNLYINLIVWDQVRRAAAATESPLMQAQLLVRWTKLLASLIVVVGLTIAAWSTDDVVVAWADALGSIFVAVYMATNARQVLRSSVPDLLDRSAGASVRKTVDDALASHVGAYSRVRRVRTRRSGSTTFIEISLDFDPGLSVAEVDRRVGAIRAALREGLGDADVTVQVSSVHS